MKSLGLLVLVAAAAAFAADLAVDDKVLYRCSLNAQRNVVVKDRKYPFYFCSTDTGDHFLFAADTFTEVNLEAHVDRETYNKLREVPVLTRPKRQFGGGFGGASAGSQASATSGGFGGGFSPGGFGFPGAGFGGGLSGAQSSSYSNAGAGGFGFGK